MKNNYFIKKTKSVRTALLFFICILFANGIQAQDTYTWVDGNTGNWSTAANWTKTGTTSANTTPGGTGGAGDIVIINNGTCTVDVNRTIRRITVGSTASAQAILNINSSQTLTITSPNLSPLTLSGGKVNNSGSLSLAVSVTAAGIPAITVSAPTNTTAGLDWGYGSTVGSALSLSSVTSGSVANQQTAVLVRVDTNTAGETPVISFNTAPTIANLYNIVYAFTVATDGKLKIGGAFTINTAAISPLFLNFLGAGTVDILSGANISVTSNNGTLTSTHVIQLNGGTLNNYGTIACTGSNLSSMRLQGNSPVTCAFNNFGTYTSTTNGYGFFSNSGTAVSTTIDNKSTGTMNITNTGNQAVRLQMASTKYVMINSGTMNLTGGGLTAANANNEIFSPLSPNESSITNTATGIINSNKGLAQFNPAVTFQDAGDTVTLNAHGLVNGNVISFTTITTTTGITINTSYFVVGATANTFQVASTAGGTAIALTTNGTGNLLSNIHKLNINNAGTITFNANNNTSENPVFSSSVNFTNTGTVNTNASSTNNASLFSANTFTSGRLSPGGDSSKSVMKIAGASIALGTTTLRINATGATPGTGYDQITASTTNGGFDLTGATLDVTGISGIATPLDIIVANGTGTITGTFATVTGLTAGWSVNYGVAGKVQLVYAVAITTYYYDGSGLLSNVTNWGANLDGSGTNPANLTDANTTYVIKNGSATTDASWTLGVGSKVVLGDTGAAAVVLTVANTFPIVGTIDVTAASSGSNSVLWQEAATTPSFGTLHAASEVHLQPTGSATYTFSSTTFGKLFIDGNSTVTFGVGVQNIQTSFTIASGSTLYVPFSTSSWIYANTAATVAINGSFKSPKTLGIFSYGVTTPGTGFGSLQFMDAVPSFTLGTASTVEYTRSGSTSASNQTQVISTLPTGVSYANLALSEATSVTYSTAKTIAGAIAVTGKLTLAQGHAGSTFVTGGFLTLKSTAAKTAVVAPIAGTVTIVGNIIVERYVPAGTRQYRLLSPATTGGTIQSNWQEGQADGANLNAGFGTHITGSGAAANGFDTTTSNAASLFTHTNTGAPAAWTAVANTNVNTLTAGSPYLIYLRGSRLATNINGALTNDATTLRTTGTLATGTRVVSGLNATADGFSLIGNPYQAQVDMQAVLLASTDLVKGFYYVLNPASGAYSTFDFALNSGTSGNANKYLQPGQACFVKTVAAPTAPALSFLETNKSELVAQTAVFKTKQLANLLRLSLYDTAKPADAVDGLIVAFDASENNAVNDNDAAKLTNFNENMATSNSGKLLSIEKRAIPTATDEIQLNITKYKGTSYSLKVQGSGLTETPFLVDAFTGTNTEIPQDGTVDYAYTVDAGNPDTTSANRFKLIYSTTLKNIDNAVSGFVLYPNPSKSNSFNVMVPQSMSRASLTVSNLLGQKLYSQNDLQSGATVRVNVSNVNTAGVYLVSLTSEGKTSTTKWIVE